MKTLLAFIVGLLIATSALALEVNDASGSQLESIKGIGPVTSTAIQEARKTKPFASWSDLMARIKGVGSNTAKKWSDQGLTVNGATLGGSQDTPAKP
jgi:competence protein ComEA